jgi:hypothetical protein
MEKEVGLKIGQKPRQELLGRGGEIANRMRGCFLRKKREGKRKREINRGQRGM